MLVIIIGVRGSNKSGGLVQFVLLKISNWDISPVHARSAFDTTFASTHWVFKFDTTILLFHNLRSVANSKKTAEGVDKSELLKHCVEIRKIRRNRILKILLEESVVAVQ